MTSSEDAKEIDYEQLLLKLPDCFVFKVPPLRSASGHRAEDWELEKPLFVGYLKIYQVSLYYFIANIIHTLFLLPFYTLEQADTKLFVRIYMIKGAYSRSPDDSVLQLSAECPVAIQPGETITNFIDAVIDSSRYFVLKIKVVYY